MSLETPGADSARTPLTGALSTYLFETRITDPLSMIAVLLTLVGAGILACLGPALRATTVDPLVALRAE